MIYSGEVCEEERGSAARQEQDKFHNRTGRMQEKLFRLCFSERLFDSPEVNLSMFAP